MTKAEKKNYKYTIIERDESEFESIETEFEKKKYKLFVEIIKMGFSPDLASINVQGNTYYIYRKETKQKSIITNFICKKNDDFMFLDNITSEHKYFEKNKIEAYRFDLNTLHIKRRIWNHYIK